MESQWKETGIGSEEKVIVSHVIGCSKLCRKRIAELLSPAAAPPAPDVSIKVVWALTGDLGVFVKAD